MKFKKGHKGYWKGKTLSKEHKEMISKSTIGLIKPTISGDRNPSKRLEFRIRQSEFMKINNPSKMECVLIKCSKRMKINNPMNNKENRDKISKAFKGRKLSDEHFKRLQEGRKNTIIPTRDTSIEIKIQEYLKQLGIVFFTHQYMRIEHGYQCDILIPSIKLVIECDGNYWHKYPIGTDIDHIRTKELIEQGFKVLRLWESEIKYINIKKFEEMIKNV